MYKIKRSGNQFIVKLVGKNGETLSTSERLHNHEDCYANIAAQARINQSEQVPVNDEAMNTRCSLLVTSESYFKNGA